MERKLIVTLVFVYLLPLWSNAIEQTKSTDHQKASVCAGTLKYGTRVSVDILRLDPAGFVNQVLHSNPDEHPFVPEEQITLIMNLIQKSISAYFVEPYDKSYHYFGGQVTEVNSLSDSSLRAIYADVRELYIQARKIGARIDLDRDLSGEEQLYFSLSEELADFLKRNPKWFMGKISSLGHLFEKDPRMTLGQFAQLLMLDYIIEKSPLLSKDQLAEGKVRFVKNHPKMKAFREFVVDRARKSYTSKIVFWGPVGLAIFHREIYTFISGLF